MWQDLLAHDSTKGTVEWQDTGSILVATSADEANALQDRQRHLAEAGLQAKYLDSAQLLAEEPALSQNVCAGLLVETDAQLVCISNSLAGTLPITASASLSVAICTVLLNIFLRFDRMAGWQHQPCCKHARAVRRARSMRCLGNPCRTLSFVRVQGVRLRL